MFPSKDPAGSVFESVLLRHAVGRKKSDPYCTFTCHLLAGSPGQMRHDFWDLNLLICKRDSGLPRWFSSKESTCQRRRSGFYPWVKKIPLEKGMTTHSGILAWRIPSTEEPGGLQCMGLQRDGHNLETKQKQQQIGLGTPSSQSSVRHTGRHPAWSPTRRICIIAHL